MFVSLWLTIGAAIFGFVFANLLAVSRLNKIPIFGILSASFVEFTRNASNSSAIFHCFWFAFSFGLSMAVLVPCVTSIILEFSAYFAEILRAGFEDVHKGQIEAAKSLGLPKMLIFVKVIFPQALCMVYPALNSQFIFYSLQQVLFLKLVSKN